MDSEYSKKLELANKLKAKKGLIASWFFPTDYYKSAELFSELGEYASTMNQMEKAGEFHRTAAETFLLSTEYGSKSRALYAYSKAGDAFRTVDPLQAADCYTQAGRYASLTGSQSIAASKYLGAAALYEEVGELEKSKANLETAMLMYEQAQMMMCKNKVAEQYTSLLLRMMDYEGAGHQFLKLNLPGREIYFGQNLLAAFLCLYLAGNEAEILEEIRDKMKGEELAIAESFDLLDHDEVTGELIEKYIGNNVLKSEIVELLKVVRERLRPENNIL
ncbi:hypothetical protein TCON_1288 [Astathelohania contejeani]|uniref:Alpha-SNAP n=1 Tax=Astathelohania contejeani TaxID=164912 RepID=A0ABQ7HZB4_9MICR|nr:hypothetical protein TCON_1288 [Thelohania contejeani]